MRAFLQRSAEMQEMRAQMEPKEGASKEVP